MGGAITARGSELTIFLVQAKVGAGVTNLIVRVPRLMLRGDLVTQL